MVRQSVIGVHASDAHVFWYFSNRVSAVPENLKATLIMPSLTLEEMQSVFPDVSTPTLRFKFNVVGGNPPMCWVLDSWLDKQVCRSRSDIELLGRDVVHGVVLWMFGAVHHPSHDPEQTETQQLGKWRRTSWWPRWRAPVAPQDGPYSGSGQLSLHGVRRGWFA
jgi:hypothetical protein